MSVSVGETGEEKPLRLTSRQVIFFLIKTTCEASGQTFELYYTHGKKHVAPLQSTEYHFFPCLSSNRLLAPIPI